MVTALELSMLDRQLDRDPEAARAMLARAREQLASGLSELRDLACPPAYRRASSPRFTPGGR